MTVISLGIVFINSSLALAVVPGDTVLPQSDQKLSLSDCRALMNHVEGHSSEVKDNFKKRFESQPSFGSVSGVSENDVLSCGIKTGHIKLWMIPYYIRYMLEFVLGLSGLLAVGGLVYGGYLYMFGGVVEDKEKGKKAILYALGGMVLVLTAWAIVNIVIAVVSA
jgi:hypothetical protein